MKLATTTGDFYSYTKSQTEALKYIREAGFRYADYSFLADFRDRTGVYAENWQEHIEQVKRAAEDLGIKLVQAHSPMGKPIAANNEQFIADTIRCVEACGSWKIPNLVVHSGYEPGLSVEETFKRNKEFFMPVLSAAEKYGVNILVENFNKMNVEGLYWVDNAPDLLRQIECVNHPLFHAVWDVGHANLIEMPQDECLRVLGGHVRALHVHDNMGDDDSHLLPYLGTTNWDSLMHGLSDIGYDGYFTFEVNNIFVPAEKRRSFEKDLRLVEAPLALRCAAERYIYETGKSLLEAYDCFDE